MDSQAGCILWLSLAVLFLCGWSYQGNRYDLECSCDRGVEVRVNEGGE